MFSVNDTGSWLTSLLAGRSSLAAFALVRPILQHRLPAVDQNDACSVAEGHSARL